MIDPILGTFGLTAALLGYALFAAGRSPAKTGAPVDLGGSPESLLLEVRAEGEVRRIRSPRVALIGRSPSAAVRLADPTVSRLHARIERRDGQTYVEDLGSRNGTSLNGKPIPREALLEVGDRVRVGSADIVFLGVGEWK